MGAASGTPSRECNGSERRGVRGGAAFARRLGPSRESARPAGCPAPQCSDPPLPPPSARPLALGRPLRPSLRPQLGFPFAWGFLQAQYSSAEPRGPLRAGWRPDRPERRQRRRRGDKIVAPRVGSAGTAGEAREELLRGSKPMESIPGTRRWACTERTWLPVPRRAPIQGRGGERGRSAKATTFSKGSGLEVGFR